MVSLRLKHERGSQNEKNFINTAKSLASISTVNNFEALRQISDQNSFDFGLSMEFNNYEDYSFTVIMMTIRVL
ncbi:Dabb family protein [Thalassotalea fonticola]|uniref:Dabb family protein n=1 Tax=Thalassotalea fonticola TaxID=3065649 RepID=UPI0038690AA5